MKEDRIEQLIKSRQLLKKGTDKNLAISLISSAETSAEVALSLKLTEKNSISIFRELYESIRQLGDAEWWILGYESQNHDVSLEILKEFDFLSAEQKIKIQFLDRFKTIRHDANYRGFKISIVQAEELIEFWKFVCRDIISYLKKKAKN